MTDRPSIGDLPQSRRVLFAGDFWRGGTEDGVAQGFSAAGWEVTFVQKPTAPAARAVASRIAKRIVWPLLDRDFGRQILEMADVAKPRAMFTVKGGGIAMPVLDALGKREVRRINYYPDVFFNHVGFGEKYLQCYDFVATTKSFHLPRLREMLGPDRVAMVHHGYVPSVHRPRYLNMAEDDYLWDVVYVGSATANKVRIMEAVVAAHPDLRIAIAGSGWELVARTNAALAPSIVAGPLMGDLYARLIEMSRITIAVHMGVFPGQEHEDLVSTRTFEIPACRGFMLHVDNEEVRTLFSVPDEIDVFSGTDELCDKIAYYVRRPELRRRMIDAAHRRAVPAYGYPERIREILRKAGLE